MQVKDLRRQRRIPFAGLIRLSWDERGDTHYCQAKCIDISENGLRVEAPVAIPAQTRISLRAEGLKLSGTAVLKNIVRRGGSKHILGLQLGQALQEKALAAANLIPARLPHREFL
jgi:PilZ domain-containing protein